MDTTIYKIKITGEGTRSHIEHSLRDMLKALEDESTELNHRTFEDEVLCMETNEA